MFCKAPRCEAILKRLERGVKTERSSAHGGPWDATATGTAEFPPSWSPIPLVAILTVLAFLVGIGSEFLADDRFLILQRLNPQRGASVFEFFRQDYWTGVEESGLYRPLGLMFLLAERELFGTWAVGYHGISLILHVLACALLWHVFRRLVGERAAAWGALLFACHPIHAEAILPVYGQLELLATVFLTVSLLECWSGHHLLGATALGLALLCKESAIVGPILIVWLRMTNAEKDYPNAALCRRVGGSVELRKALWRAADVPYWAALACVVGLRIAVLGSMVMSREATVLGNGGFNLWVKSVIVTAGHAIRLCVWPTGQTVYYGHLRDSLLRMPIAEAFWIAVGFSAAWLLANWLPRGSAMAAIGWFVICLLPVSNIVPIGVLVAERTLYLPSAGITALAGLCCVRLEAEVRNWQRLRAVHAAFGIVLIVASVMSARVAWRWRTELSLWRSTAADHPRSPKAHAMLGHAILQEVDKGRGDPTVLIRQADICFEEALRLNPNSADALYGRGLILRRKGSCQKALPYFSEAAALRPSDEVVQRALAECQDNR